MGPLTLHVGSGKCGSTAIQAALTGRPVILLGSGEATCAVLDSSGRATTGREVVPGPLEQACKSAKLEHLAVLAPDRMDAVREPLLATSYPVMSSKRWLGTPELARQVLRRWGLPVRLVVHVHPQVDYVNAALWRWDIWNRTTRERWIDRRIRRSQ